MGQVILASVPLKAAENKAMGTVGSRIGILPIEMVDKDDEQREEIEMKFY
jgi:hypothetical protein